MLACEQALLKDSLSPVSLRLASLADFSFRPIPTRRPVHRLRDCPLVTQSIHSRIARALLRKIKDCSQSKGIRSLDSNTGDDDVVCGFGLWVPRPAPRVFRRVLWVSSLHKKFLFGNSTWKQWMKSHSEDMPLQIPVYFILFYFTDN